MSDPMPIPRWTSAKCWMCLRKLEADDLVSMHFDGGMLQHVDSKCDGVLRPYDIVTAGRHSEMQRLKKQFLHRMASWPPEQRCFADHRCLLIRDEPRADGCVHCRRPVTKRGIVHYRGCPHSTWSNQKSKPWCALPGCIGPLDSPNDIACAVHATSPRLNEWQVSWQIDLTATAADPTAAVRAATDLMSGADSLARVFTCTHVMSGRSFTVDLTLDEVTEC